MSLETLVNPIEKTWYLLILISFVSFFYYLLVVNMSLKCFKHDRFCLAFYPFSYIIKKQQSVSSPEEEKTRHKNKHKKNRLSFLRHQTSYYFSNSLILRKLRNIFRLMIRFVFISIQPACLLACILGKQASFNGIMNHLLSNLNKKIYIKIEKS